jgi:hypothetical protein
MYSENAFLGQLPLFCFSPVLIQLISLSYALGKRTFLPPVVL